MKVNVVMLCYQRHFLTHQALRTLYRNTPHELYNFTLIDDGSAIPPMVHEGEAYLKVGYSQHITGKLRNLGVYWSEKHFGRGDYLYLSDCDVYFTPHWLENLTQAMAIPTGCSLIGGWNHPYMQPQEALVMGNGMCVKTHDAVTGSSQMMRWETWDQFGPLSGNAEGVCQGEDWEFCQKIIKTGGLVGSLYPRVVFNCGLTNSYGKASVGADVVLKELQEAKKIYPDLYYE